MNHPTPPPIYIAPHIGKIFDSVIKPSNVLFLETSNIFGNGQFGFRQGNYTAQALSKVVGDVIEGLEEGNRVGLTMYDLSKAFDCISHEFLQQKLFRYGFRGNALGLSKYFLENRSQCVRDGDYESNFAKVAAGIP